MNAPLLAALAAQAATGGDWRDRGACRGHAEPDLWHAADGGYIAQEQTHRAQAICHTCPVRLECGEYALETRQDWGVWGGMTKNQRRAILRKRGQDAQETAAPEPPAPKRKREPSTPPACGERRMYLLHLQRGESCERCRGANAAADRRYRLTGSTKAAR
ncbi:WhiB family transcriptional regulator [Streptomyces sp. C1-2]|uniref:WhiB family transcriptional regulator n=1 Tax=Streptomyces sp. C1-2 TaxID=2720022 RepID=UPI00143267E1|nr:WhiB family transcriptional regulator [Streptomyces sp. C1-2]